MNPYLESAVDGMSLGDNIKTLYREPDDHLPADPIGPTDSMERMRNIYAMDAVRRRFGRLVWLPYPGGHTISESPHDYDPYYGYPSYQEPVGLLGELGHTVRDVLDDIFHRN